MNIAKTTAVIAAGLLAFAGCQQAPKNTDADKSEMQDGTRAWAVAYNAGDADGVVALYGEDAVVMPPGAPVVYGRAAIRDYIAGDSAAAKAAGLTLTIEHGDSVGISGDVAWHSGPYSISDATGARVAGGSYIEALQKVDGKWYIVRDIWNSDSPPAAAPATTGETAAAPAN
jgi:ketosteroid isomerase-like protein